TTSTRASARIISAENWASLRASPASVTAKGRVRMSINVVSIPSRLVISSIMKAATCSLMRPCRGVLRMTGMNSGRKVAIELLLPQTLWFGELHDVAVRVAQQKSFGESQRCLWQCDYAWGDKGKRPSSRLLRCYGNIASYQPGLPVCKIVGSLVGGDRATIAWCQVFEKFDART